jgi:wyosine [tRNA(Phe)-imidazoG37] synthetase (radical SAM superfamily)
MNLTVTYHPSKFANLEYVYPVFARRSEGLSLGINLNVNKACNWRCIYCQVTDLKRGAPDRIDLIKLEAELKYMLDVIINTDYLQQNLPKGFERFDDIALAGDGEPTLSKDFLAVINLIAKLKQEFKITNSVKTILISNGSEVNHLDVQKGLQELAQQNGVIWFKIDGTNTAETSLINQIQVSRENIKNRLEITAKLCPTIIQTCMFKINNNDPSVEQVQNYINLLKETKHNFDSVLLYSIARPPQLPEGKNLSPVSFQFLQRIAEELQTYGIAAKCFA